MSLLLPQMIKTRIRVYTAGEAAKVIGCTQASLRGWRNQNNFLPDARTDGWTRFSAVDIALARAVRVLIELGLSAPVAVDVAMKLLPRFEELLGMKGVSEIAEQQKKPLIALIFPQRQKPTARLKLAHCHESIGSAFRQIGYGHFIALDILTICEDVQDALPSANHEASGEDQ